MITLRYRHPVSVLVIVSHSHLHTLSARDCIHANEIVYCTETRKYYEGFQSSHDSCRYYFREFVPLDNRCCDFCGAVDTYGHRIVLQKITVKKPDHDIHPEARDFINTFRLKEPTLEKFLCASCREAIVNARRS